MLSSIQARFVPRKRFAPPRVVACGNGREGLFDSLATSERAAGLCSACPALDECLITALSLDGARRAGLDRYGVFG